MYCLFTALSQYGKVPIPAHLGKNSAKNSDIGEFRIVKSSYWEIGVSEFLLTNNLKLITKCCQVVNIILTYIQAILLHRENN